MQRLYFHVVGGRQADLREPAHSGSKRRQVGPDDGGQSWLISTRYPILYSSVSQLGTWAALGGVFDSSGALWGFGHDDQTTSTVKI